MVLATSLVVAIRLAIIATNGRKSYLLTHLAYLKQGIFNEETGQSFLSNILEKGGSEEPSELFKNFRGRAPEIDALLRHSGIEA